MTQFEVAALGVALVFIGGFAAGLWVGFKLWRETYVRGISPRQPRGEL